MFSYITEDAAEHRQTIHHYRKVISISCGVAGVKRYKYSTDVWYKHLLARVERLDSAVDWTMMDSDSNSGQLSIEPQQDYDCITMTRLRFYDNGRSQPTKASTATVLDAAWTLHVYCCRGRNSKQHNNNVASEVAEHPPLQSPVGLSIGVFRPMDYLTNCCNRKPHRDTIEKQYSVAYTTHNIGLDKGQKIVVESGETIIR